MNLNNKAIDMLIKKMVYITDTKTKNLKYDKTFKTTVWKVNSDGTYGINYLGQMYNVPNALGTLLSPGQSVWVNIPSGIIRNMFICGVNKWRKPSAGSIDELTEIVSELRTEVNKNTEDIESLKIAIEEFEGSVALSNNVTFEPLES